MPSDPQPEAECHERDEDCSGAFHKSRSEHLSSFGWSKG
jgi:hypothetical protein